MHREKIPAVSRNIYESFCAHCNFLVAKILTNFFSVYKDRNILSPYLLLLFLCSRLHSCRHSRSGYVFWVVRFMYAILFILAYLNICTHACGFWLKTDYISDTKVISVSYSISFPLKNPIILFSPTDTVFTWGYANTGLQQIIWGHLLNRILE